MSVGEVAGTRRRAGLLLSCFPRLLSWWPLAASAAASLVVVGWKWALLDEIPGALWVLRAIAVLLILGCLFLYDDASWFVADASPTTRRQRVGLRMGVVFAIVGTSLMLLLAVVLGRAPADSLSWSITLGMSIEFLSLTLVAIAVAVSLRRWMGYAEPGQFAAAGFVMLLVTLSLIQQRWPLFAVPGPEWTDAHLRWIILAAIAATLIVLSLADPYARLRPRSRNTAPPLGASRTTYSAPRNLTTL